MDPTKNDEARRKLTDKGASMVASLKLRVSRLEATLRSKEAELAKLHASTKTTAFNEVKIEAETYYQEVVRLRNQLNIVQQQQQHQHQYYPVNQQQQQQPPAPPPHQQPQLPPPPPPPHHNHQAQQFNVTANANTTQPAASSHSTTMRGKREGREAPLDKRGGGDGQESPTSSLRHALSLLGEENSRLGQQVSALESEKDKLTADLERVLGLTEEVKGNFEGMSRAELIREVERREAEVVRWETQHRQLTEALSKHSEQAGENSALLQARVAELQAREEEWNRERLSLQELINTLKDDRIFYKEAVQKKDSDLEGLRHEVQALQQEVLSLQGAHRRRGDRPAAASPHSRIGTSTASRSGSSSDARTPPIRRTRPSSARPPAPGTRPQRGVKASSEPRETPSPSRQRTPLQQSLRKPSSVKSSSTRTASSSIPSSSQTSPRKQPVPPPTGRSGVTRQSRQPTSSSSFSSKASTPTASPSKVPGRVTSSSSSSSPQHRSSLSSPYHRNSVTKLSKQHNGVNGSPQYKEGVTASPKHKNGIMGSPRVKPGSPAKTPTPRSSSRSSTPSSQVRSSPAKVAASPRSPSKVPQPSPRGRKSSTEAVQTTPQPASSGLSSTEEDERVLAEIIFQRDTDTSQEAGPDTPRSAPMSRQRTVTLDTQDEEEESVKSAEQVSLSSQRMSSKEGVEEEVAVREQQQQASPGRRRRDKEVAENLDVLRSLLSGHLRRQQEVNHLLTSAPLLVGESLAGDGTGLHSSRRASGGGQGKKSPRQAPEGAEGSGRSGLVRQGTFNVDEEGMEGEAEGSVALNATLDGHLARSKGVKQLK